MAKLRLKLTPYMILILAGAILLALTISPSMSVVPETLFGFSEIVEFTATLNPSGETSANLVIEGTAIQTTDELSGTIFVKTNEVMIGMINATDWAESSESSHTHTLLWEKQITGIDTVNPTTMWVGTSIIEFKPFVGPSEPQTVDIVEPRTKQQMRILGMILVIFGGFLYLRR